MTYGLRQTMNVYTEGVGGGFTVLAQSAIPCQLWHIDRRPAEASDARTEWAAIRNLHYDPSVTLPDYCQIEVTEDGVTHRYNPVFGTEGDIRPFNTVIQRRIDCVRAENG